MRQELQQIDASPATIRRFGALMAGIGVLVAGFIVWRSGWFISTAAPWIAGIGLSLGALSAIVPAVVRPVYRLWMALAIVLGFVMTRVILTLVFVLIVTPTGLIMRVLRRDPLAKHPDSTLETYWIGREDNEDTEDPATRMRRYY